MILDGFGLRENTEANAVALAHTPHLDDLMSGCPVTPVETSGYAVGLPEGVMGNSEVGHMNIGAGRVVKQDLVRINDAIKTGELRNNPALLSLLNTVINNNSTLHLIGLFSDGGVHSHLDHVKEIIRIADAVGVPRIAIHAFTDGRDTPPTGGVEYIKDFSAFLEKFPSARIATVCGRYYAMDRDTRWDRTEKAYRMLTSGEGERFANAEKAVTASYDSGVTDEFIMPKIIGEPKIVGDGDGILAFNFRADRMRQITRAFTSPGFSEFPVVGLNVSFTSMTRYQEDFTFPVLFPPVNLSHIFPQVLSENGYTQLRIAETEKYAHVTYFFNGGEEKVFPGEERILVPSPWVATYDLQPEMSALEVTRRVIRVIVDKKYDAIILNFANPDMVGHTGDLSAAIKALETVDYCVGEIRKAVKKTGCTMFLTSDHGNLEMMVDPVTGKPHTAHTTLPVPFVLDCHENNLSLSGKGKLADIAPTILDYLHLPIPAEMDGSSLLVRK